MSDQFRQRIEAMVAGGRLSEAVQAARLQVRTHPKDADSIGLLGRLLQSTGQLDQAIAQFARVVSLQPGSMAARDELAHALLDARRPREAVEHWEAATRLAPDNPFLWASLAMACPETGDLDRAIEAGERSVALAPSHPGCVANLAVALLKAGETDRAFRIARAGYEQNPGEHMLGSITLLMSNYGSHALPEILQLHRRFGAAVGTPVSPARTAPDALRAIRVGILSGDLRDHSVAFFAEALIAGAPADVAIEVFDGVAPHGRDAASGRLRGLGGTWHDCSAMDDAALDALIRSRRIDVLVELGGHTGVNRLPCLAAKPAPVIVTAIGYPNTTGVPAVDWRVVDSITDPPGAEAWCSERLLRLDPCFLCYVPPEEAPIPVLPAADAPITFGSFNNAAKIGTETVRLWARVLDAVPGSRLVLKSQSLACAATQSRIRARFQDAGIAGERLELFAQTPSRADHLALYGRVHVALDTVPYNGTTTTCEALWMGVPVVAVLGDRHAARVSASLLHAVGLQDLMAADADGFVRLAAGLASDRARLAALRQELRDRMRASPLLDRAGYALRFHAALRGCWAAWCSAAPRS